MATTALPPAPTPPGPNPGPGAARAEALVRQWAALHQAAGLVGGLAGQAPDAAALVEPCPAAIAEVRGWRQALIAQGLADTAAILQGGIRALLVARAEGAAVTPAAEALWQEFVTARQAIVDLARPG